MLHPSFVEIGLLVLVKKIIKEFTIYTDRRSNVLTDHFSNYLSEKTTNDISMKF